MKFQKPELKVNDFSRVFKNLEYLSIFDQLEFLRLNYECEICKMRFALSISLENHKRSHTREEEYAFIVRSAKKKRKTFNNFDC